MRTTTIIIKDINDTGEVIQVQRTLSNISILTSTSPKEHLLLSVWEDLNHQLEDEERALSELS